MFTFIIRELFAFIKLLLNLIACTSETLWQPPNFLTSNASVGFYINFIILSLILTCGSSIDIILFFLGVFFSIKFFILSGIEARFADLCPMILYVYMLRCSRAAV